MLQNIHIFVIFSIVHFSFAVKPIKRFQVFNKPTPAELRNAKSRFPTNHALAAGSEFIMAFINSHQVISDNSHYENLTLIVNNPNAVPADITVSSIYPDFTTISTQVPANGATIIYIAPHQIQTNYGRAVLNNVVTENKGILIRSSVSVQIVAVNERNDSRGVGEAYAIFPTCQLGMSYKVFGDSVPQQTTRQYSIVATQDNTTVMYNAWNLGLSLQTVVLNRLQTHTYTTFNYYMTGARVIADKPVAVVSGVVCGLGWLALGYCNHMAAMMISTDYWGTTFPLVNLQPATDGCEYILNSYMDGTIIYDDGVPLLTINSDQFARFYYPTSILTTSWPCDVMQVCSRFNATHGDPCFLHIPSDNLFINGSTQFLTGYSTADQTTVLHYVRITTNVAYVGMIRIDGGAAPSSLLYTRVGRSTFYYYETLIGNGVHVVSGANAAVRFSVAVYGYGPDRGYGFTPGIDMPASMAC
jgi:hypothetical protein